MTKLTTTTKKNPYLYIDLKTNIKTLKFKLVFEKLVFFII